MENKNIKKVKLYRQWIPEYGEFIDGDSITVPGESYTIEELFHRANIGLPVDVSIKGDYYGDDADLDVFAPEADTDFADLHEHAMAAQITIEEAKVKYKEAEEVKKTKQGTKAQQSEAIVTELDKTITSANEVKNNATLD